MNACQWRMNECMPWRMNEGWMNKWMKAGWMKDILMKEGWMIELRIRVNEKKKMMDKKIKNEWRKGLMNDLRMNERRTNLSWHYIPFNERSGLNHP
jgi:hypothetical protein